MADKPFRRLPGRSSALFAKRTLWEADDHLLLVSSTGVSESYRRFFYRDIGAIIVARTRTWITQAIVFALLALVLGLGGYWAISRIEVLAGVLWAVAGFFALLAAASLLRGPTCKCALRTPLQTHPLPSLNRLRTARKVIAKMKPRIEAAQAGAR